MKKLFFLFIFALLLIPVAMAGVVLDEVKGYINDEVVSDIDSGGGGEFEVSPGDIITIKVVLINNENSTTKAEIRGIIQNIDDDEDLIDDRYWSWYDISANNDRSRTLSFTIPSDVSYNDDFDLDIEMRWKNSSDNTNNLDTKSYIISIIKPVEREISINEILVNLSASCMSLKDATTTCFGFAARTDTCNADLSKAKDELSTVKEERGVAKQQTTDCQSSLEKATTDLTSATNDKINLQNQIENMYTISYCNNITASAVTGERKRSDKNTTQILGIGAVGIIVYVLWQKNKKKKTSTATSYEAEYFEKR